MCILSTSTPQAQDTRAYYLSPYIGTGSDTDPFRPHGLNQSGAGCIDLRPNGTVATGFAICAAPILPAQPGVISIAASSISTLNAARRTALSTALGATITASTPVDLLVELLLTHARTDGSRWKPLRAGRDGKYHIYLGPQVYQQTAWLYPYVEDHGLVADASNALLGLVEPELAWATTLAEDWNCADNASLTCDLTWTEVVGTALGIVSNQARISTASTSVVARADSDLATDDHEVQATFVTMTLSSGTIVAARVLCRKDATATETFYQFSDDVTATPEHSLGRREAGVTTQIGASDPTDHVNGEVDKIRCDGSAITGFINGVASIGPITDMNITGNLRGGVRVTTSTGSPVIELDNWSAIDYTGIASGRRRHS